MAVTRSSGRWRRAIKMPLPASSHGAEFESVACTGVGSCVAVGELFTNAAFNGIAIRAVESHGRWARPVRVPAPANAATGTKLFSILFAVTCVGSRACVTVGSYQDNMGDFSEGMAAVIPAP